MAEFYDAPVDKRSAETVGALGTLGALGGAFAFLLGFADVGYGDKLLAAGGLLVLSGLLLRIEAAIWRSSGPTAGGD
ncbi:hypothetical protein [Micromonospora sp. C95]|uniref:hypothetical protein n=1 Tax=Micromonospora sp. C95 TaxID=2824882 RepID=UPI001B3822A2|nr:hypothetical protein [Micromonospora sp. C95]MBQ1024271.1 hypothetical protein [Micromonospora sp. C95]